MDEVYRRRILAGDLALQVYLQMGLTLEDVRAVVESQLRALDKVQNMTPEKVDQVLHNIETLLASAPSEN